MQPEQVIKKPIVLTEKSAIQREAYNKYFFVVHPKSTKLDIRRAVEALFDVRVKDVQTMIVRGKPKRIGREFIKRRNWKKAMISLHDGETIDLFEGA